MRIRHVFSLLILLALACPARAGVTIHYEGTAVSADAIAKILAAVTAFAKKNKWKVEDASSKAGRLQRVIDEKDRDYEGRVLGVVVRIGDDCEPLHFQFGDDLFMQDYVKTQFAGADVHMRIVELLDSLRPFFAKLGVVDEGDFWDTRDRAVLESHISKINSLIAEEKRKNPRVRGPLRMQSGRIADIVQ